MYDEFNDIATITAKFGTAINRTLGKRKVEVAELLPTTERITVRTIKGDDRELNDTSKCGVCGRKFHKNTETAWFTCQFCGETVCPDCDCYTCNGCQKSGCDNCVFLIDGQYLCRDCAAERGYNSCDDCDAWWFSEDLYWEEYLHDEDTQWLGEIMDKEDWVALCPDCVRELRERREK